MKTEPSSTLTTVLVVAGVVISLFSGGDIQPDPTVARLADIGGTVQGTP